MAITEKNYLHIHQGHNSYLLLRGPHHYHLVLINVTLAEGGMEKLLRIYPCSEEVLTQKGFRVTSFKISNLRRVITEGTQMGDKLDLWVGSVVQQYSFGSDYSQEVLNAFFEGTYVEHRKLMQWNGLPLPMIRKITWGVNGFSIAIAIIFSLWGNCNRALSVLCLLCQLVCTVLPMLFPESFTLAEKIWKGNPVRISKYQPGSLVYAFVAVITAMTVRAMTDFNMSFNSYLLISGIMAILAVCAFLGGLWKFQRVRIASPSHYIGLIIFVVFMGFGTVAQLNYALDFAPNISYEVQVAEKTTHGVGRGTSYYCFVELPNGEIRECHISRLEYNRLVTGQDVLLNEYAGVFGIPFSTLEHIDED